jgi:hypothetical protein
LFLGTILGKAPVAALNILAQAANGMESKKCDGNPLVRDSIVGELFYVSFFCCERYLLEFVFLFCF